MQILPRPERTRAVVLAVCGALRDMICAATDTYVSVLVTTHDPETYISLK